MTVLLSVAVIVLVTVLIWIVALCVRPMTVSFTFDDGARAHLTIAAPLLEKFGWRGAFNVCTDFCDRNASTFTEEMRRVIGMSEHPELRLDWSDVRELLRRGHEVYPHACTHINLKALWNDGERERVRREISGSAAAFRKYIGVTPLYFCCPHLAWNHAIQKIARMEGMELFNNWRPGVGGGNAGDTTAILMRLQREGRRHVDLMFHGIVCAEGGADPFENEEAFERVLASVDDLSRKGFVRVVPYAVAHRSVWGVGALADFDVWLKNKIRRIVFKTGLSRFLVVGVMRIKDIRI